MEPDPIRRIAIIGGGLSGLSAAHRLIELSRGDPASTAITLFEASPRLGGIVGTQQVGDYLVDTGADSFLTNKPGAVGLCRRLGLEHRLVATDARYRGAHVLFEGRPVRVPDGFQLISPSAAWPMLTTPLLTPWGKLRMFLEWFVPPGNFADESLADFVRRRFGREALDKLVQPLVGGIYTSDPEKLSVAATMPRFLEMERQFGSLLRASLKQRSVDRQNSAEPSDTTSSGARYGLFAGLAEGMEELLVALRTTVVAGCQIRTSTRIQAVQRASRPIGYKLVLSDGMPEEFDAVIVATTAHQAARLLQDLDSDLATDLAGIEYASSAIVVTGHKLANVRHPLDSFGLVVPHCERRRILATSFSSRKFPVRAPADSVLMRTFVGGAMQPEMFDLDDETLCRVVMQELGEIFGVQGDAEFSLVVRYPRAMPQYHVGHLDRVGRIESRTATHAGLALAGNALRGVGVPDAISSGEAAAAVAMQG
ncbi:MAG: protoporphyrinogen oxidase [Planctomycetes bacterium]|nr:protoporphyrinogen oxidase [Planctomycetota bacterium]